MKYVVAMARRDIFKGKSIEQIREIPPEEFNKFDKKTLAAAVTRMASAANKRLRRFEKSGIETPATISVSKSGGKFSVKGKSLNQLRSEFIRVKNFLGMKTATQKGYAKVKRDFIERVNATAQQSVKLSDKFLNRFWRIYDKTANLAPFVKGSPDRQKMVFDLMVDNPELSEDDLLTRLNDTFDSRYEEEQMIEYEYGTSSFFEIS